MKNKCGGFTLAEVIVGFMIAAIIITAAGGVFAFGSKNFLEQAVALEDSQVGESIGRMVKDSLTYAYDIKITGSRPEDEELLFLMFSEDGRFYMNGTDVFGDGYYKNRKISCRIIPGREQTVKIEVQIEDHKGNQKYCGQTVITFMNRKLTGREVDHRMKENRGVIESKEQDVVLCYQKEDGRADE